MRKFEDALADLNEAIFEHMESPTELTEARIVVFCEEIATRSQGPCETTQTERFKTDCTCTTYPGNLGPCAEHCRGSNGRCVYCDHELTCAPAKVKRHANKSAV